LILGALFELDSNSKTKKKWFWGQFLKIVSQRASVNPMALFLKPLSSSSSSSSRPLIATPSPASAKGAKHTHGVRSYPGRGPPKP